MHTGENTIVVLMTLLSLMVNLVTSSLMYILRESELYGDESSAAEEEKKKEDEFKNTLAKFVNLTLLSDEKVANVKAARALSLILQANSQLGIFIVNHGAKPESKMGKLAKLAQEAAKAQKSAKAAEEVEEEKMEDGPETEVGEEKVDDDADDDKPTIEDVTHEEESATKEPAKDPADQVPFPLRKLMELTTSLDEDVNVLTSEVLALASSDNLVRSTIMAGCGPELFERQMDSSDLVIKTTAALALSKLAAVGELEQTVEQQKEVLSTMMQALEEAHSKQEASSDSDSSKRTVMIEAHGLAQALRNIAETLAYLTLHIDVKKQLAMHKRGAWLTLVFIMAKSSDQAVRYALLTVVRNLTTSQDAMEKEYDAEVAALRKVAQKGLPGAEAASARNKQRAGTSQAIKVITRLLVRAGVVSFLVESMRAYAAAAREAQELLERQTRGTGKDAVKKARPGQAGFAGLSPVAAETMAASLLVMADDQENRGVMVQQGALPLLMNLYEIKGKNMHQAGKQHEQQYQWRTDSALALARIAITTNPNLFPQQGVAFDMVPPLLMLCKTASHELHQFEALMALTNLSSMGPDLRDKIMVEKGWTELTMLLASENYRVQRAAVECLTNLVMCEKAMERLHSPAGEQDIRFFLIFSQTSDVPTQCAATGALAMISSDPVLALKIASLRLAGPVVEDGAEQEGATVEEVTDEEEGDESKDDDGQKKVRWAKFGDGKKKLREARSKQRAEAQQDDRTGEQTRPFPPSECTQGTHPPCAMLRFLFSVGLSVLGAMTVDPETDPNVRVRLV